jgi:hypothetical protein
VALDRALSDNPRYTMAQLLRQAIDSGAPPSLARIPMSSEEVAASYDEAEGTMQTTALPTVRRWTTRPRPVNERDERDGASRMSKRNVAARVPAVTKPRGRRLNCLTRRVRGHQGADQGFHGYDRDTR